MRTTITLEPDVEAAVRRLMRDRRLSFKVAVNEAIRSGLRPELRAPSPSTTVVSMGVPVVPLDRALRLAAELEDDEFVRKLALRK